MPSAVEPQSWDLSHVLDLIGKLSVDPKTPQPHKPAVRGDKFSHDNAYSEVDRDGPRTEARDFAVQSSHLGDFSRIFQVLGTPLSSTAAAPGRGAYTGEQTHVLPSWDQYASDGATYIKPRAGHEEIVHEQGFSTADDTLTDPVSDGSVGSEVAALTKKERKKLRKKERKEEKRKKQTLAIRLAASNVASESEADFASVRTPARKASAHFVSSASQKSTSKKTVINKPTNLSIGGHNTSKTERKKLQNLADTPSKPPKRPPQVGLGQDQNTTLATPKAKPSSISPTPNGHLTSPPSTPSIKPLAGEKLKFTPASVMPRPNTAKSLSTHQPPSSQPEPSILPLTNRPRMIEPMIVRSGEDRNWTLLNKLITGFWSDRKYLINPMNLTTHNNDPKGIHVFVDASNIFIGFNEQLKRSRRIPLNVHVPPVGLSFDALALLMERRRPTAKRVLVGSTPHLPAFDKAKAVGYECNILEKVYKARELTERQIYFKDLEDRATRRNTKVPKANNVIISNGSGEGGGTGSGSGSASETTGSTPQFAKAAMIEQGVDEILHLKILESVVDADAPGTMVLATGDAAQAEYSEGFMATAQRALKKGWSVELVSWGANISSMYRKREWVQAWGERFKIVLLDDYAEELLDM